MLLHKKLFFGNEYVTINYVYEWATSFFFYLQNYTVTTSPHRCKYFRKGTFCRSLEKYIYTYVGVIVRVISGVIYIAIKVVF